MKTSFIVIAATVALILITVGSVHTYAYEYCPWWMECLGWC